MKRGAAAGIAGDPTPVNIFVLSTRKLDQDFYFLFYMAVRTIATPPAIFPKSFSKNRANRC